jgi:hypothetical protein
MGSSPCPPRLFVAWVMAPSLRRWPHATATTSDNESKITKCGWSSRTCHLYPAMLAFSGLSSSRQVGTRERIVADSIRQQGRSVRWSAMVSMAAIFAAVVGVRAGIPARAAALRSTAATPQTVLDGPACPDVMVIAARGSGEAPADWAKLPEYTQDRNHGAGAVLFDLYSKHLQSARKDLTFSLEPVVYPAENVKILLKNTKQYIADAGIGALNIVADIKYFDKLCGSTVRYVLAGYSLGAWAVHDALHKLTRTQLGRLDGIALFGDPKFAPGLPIVRDYAKQDIYHGVAYRLVDKAGNPIPATVASRTGSWCFPNDPVCQVLGKNPNAWLAEVALCALGSSKCAHFQYPAAETAKAAAFLAPLLPKTSLWPHLSSASPPTGVTGRRYNWQATVEPPGHYKWTVTGALPRGLTLSLTGSISGTPTQPGKYPFTITVAGSYQRVTHSDITITVTLGNPWTPTRAPLPSGAGSQPNVNLDAVACTSASSCLAAGNYTDSSSDQQGVLEVLANGIWTADKAPLPGNAAANPAVNITAVSCGSTSTCAAVGHYTDIAGNQQGLLEVLADGAWTPAQAPLPASANPGHPVDLTSVACASPSSCVAVGQENQGGIIETLANGSWTSQWAPAPANSGGSPPTAVMSVNCPTASFCLAVGYYWVVINPSTGAGYNAGVLDTLSAGTWSPQEAPTPDGNPSLHATFLRNVACASESACQVTGEADGNPLLETLSGATWTSEYAPLPPNAQTGPFDVAAINSVACPSPSSCTAAGVYNYSDIGLSEGLLLTQTPTGWSPSQAPHPNDIGANADVIMSAVACASGSSCVAVGSYNGPYYQNYLGLLEVLSGTSWTVWKAPVPGSDTVGFNSGLSAITCPSTTCVAVGSYQDPTLASQGLILTGPA